MNLTFLSASVNLTKSFKKNTDGIISKTSYPHAYEFISKTKSISSLKKLTERLREQSATGSCLLKGNTTKPLQNESRAGSTDSNESTTWACLDIDGLKTIANPDHFMAVIGLPNISYVIQYSASYKIQDNHLRCHIFIELTKPQTPQDLKRWLIHLNLAIPELNSECTLTKNNMAIHWPLDISACQNDKLIYIAPPILDSISDPCPNRIQLITKRSQTADLDLADLPYKPELQNRTADLVNSLRKLAGLRQKTQIYKYAGEIEYLANPDKLVITDQKTERGFTYFNLNGGDSWGYYHPENNSEFIFNFKNEPIYLTKDLLPEYWLKAGTRICTPKFEAGPDLSKPLEGVQYFAFRDGPTSRYMTARFDPNKDTLKLQQVRNETQVKHFLDEHGQPSEGFIPEWEIVYDPSTFEKLNPANRTVNIFEPSKYMLKTATEKAKKAPPTIHRLIHHVFGNDKITTEYWINHFAFIIQNRKLSGTAWLAQGIQGTGKGVLFNHVIKPLLGESNVCQICVSQLEENYNDYMYNSLYIMVDEMQKSNALYSNKIESQLRNAITEPTLQIRRMYSSAVRYPNHTNFFFASNMPDPIEIQQNDRRFNIGYYQIKRIHITEEDLELIESELGIFYSYLMDIKIDHKKIRTPLLNDARSQMQIISQQALDGVCDMLREGNLVGLSEMVVPLTAEDTLANDYYVKKKFNDLIRRFIHELPDKLTREEVQLIVEHCVGGAPKEPGKFTAKMNHHRIHINVHNFNGVSKRGIKIEWKISNMEITRLKKEYPLTKPNLKVVK